MNEVTNRIIEIENSKESIANYVYANFPEYSENIYEAYLKGLLDDYFNNKYDFIKEYINKPNYVEDLKLEELSPNDLSIVLISFLFILPYENYKQIILYYSKLIPDIIDYIVIAKKEDIDFLLSLGYNETDIMSSNLLDINDELTKYICDLQIAKNGKIDDKFYDFLMSENIENCGFLIIEEIKKGDYSNLNDYLNGIYEDNTLQKFLNYIANEKINNPQEIFNRICLIINDNKSVIKDEETAKKLFNVFGDNAIIFIDNPSEEIVSLLKDFSITEYMNINGDYKKSPYLLKWFLLNGDYDALSYTVPEAITDEIMRIIDEKNINIRSYTNKRNNPIKQSFAYNTVQIKKGDYSSIKNINNIYTDLNTFNYIYDVISNGPDDIIDKLGIGPDNTIFNIILYLQGKRVPNNNIIIDDISKEVANRLIELGLKFEDAISLNIKSESLYNEFVKHGERRAAFISEEFNSEVGSTLTYEDYLDIKSTFPQIKLGISVAKRLITEGHLDILESLDEINQINIIRHLNLNSISKEDYLKLPESVQNIPSLKEHFQDYSLDDIVKNIKESYSPTPSLYTKAYKSGMSCQDLLSLVIEKKTYVLEESLIVELLKNGYREAIKYYRFNPPNTISEEIIDLYYNLLNGELPFKQEWEIIDNTLKKQLTKKYLKEKKYGNIEDNERVNISEIIDKNTIDNEIRDILTTNNYSAEDFMKNPVYDGKVIESIINQDNIDQIIDMLIKNNKKIFKSEELLKYLYKLGIPNDKFKTISGYCDFDLKDLIINLNKEEYGMLKLLKINQEMFNPETLSFMIDSINPNELEAMLGESIYISEENMQNLVDTMVEKGNPQFIKYYKNLGNKNTLKNAVINGYVPSYQEIKNSRFLKNNILDIPINEDEKAILKENLKTNPRNIIYLQNDFSDNKEVIYECVEQQPDLVWLLNEQYRKDSEIIKRIANKDEYIASLLIREVEDIELFKEIITINPSIIDYLQTSLSEEEKNEIVKLYPKTIDRYDNFDDQIDIAFEKGYVLNKNSNYKTIYNAIKNDRELPKDIWSMDNISNLIESLNTKEYERRKEDILPIFNKLVVEGQDDFIAKLVYNNEHIGMSNLEEILKLNGYSTEIKDFSNSEDEKEIVFRINLLKLEQLPKEEQLKIIYQCLENEIYRDRCIDWLEKNNYTSELQDFSKKNYKKDPLFYILNIRKEDKDEELISYCKQLIDSDVEKYYKLCDSVPEVLDNKTRLSSVMDYNLSAFQSSPYQLQLDYDIALKYYSKEYYDITRMPKETEDYEKICYEVLKIHGIIYNRIDFWKDDPQALIIALKTYKEAIKEAKPEVITDEVIASVDDLQALPIEDLPPKTIAKIIESDSFDITNQKLVEKVLSIIQENPEEYTYTDKMSRMIVNELRVNPNLIYSNHFILLEKIDQSYLTEEDIKNIENANTILKAYGKVNTLEKNPVFSYDLVKHAYPSIGLENTVDLLKYNSGAAEELIKLAKANEIPLASSYYELIKKYNIFPDNDKCLHFAFRYFSNYKELIKNLIGTELSEQEITNLKKVIMNKNQYYIETREQLNNYEQVVENYIKVLLSNDDINKIKDYLSTMFGFEDLDNLSNYFTTHQVDNFPKQMFILKEIRDYFGEEKEQEFKLTEEEIKVIILMKKIIETNDIDNLKKLIIANTNEDNQIFDFSDIVYSMTQKMRKMYTAEFNTKLTKIESLESKIKTERKVIIDHKGEQKEATYEIIDMDGEPFNFLAHRIYNYDPKFKEFINKILKDPSLWSRLDGSSTLSTSSISDKGLWMIKNTDNSGVIYLFNDLPEDFMLFMYGRDLKVQHGGHKLEPTADYNGYTDLDSLNQSTAANHAKTTYNEVAGFRAGMKPKAIACVGDEPTEDQIRAADYFKIPIIRFNVKEYETKKKEDYEAAKSRMQNLSTKEDIYNIVYNGIKGEKIDTTIELCTNFIRNSYKSKKIDYKEMLEQLIYLRSLINRVIEPNDKNKLRKIELLIQTIALEKQVSEEEIIDLEEANMGESGIMYQMQEKGKTVLIKPSVDKQNLRLQNFRAEIQKSASTLQQIISEDTAVPVEVIGDSKLRLSKQEKIKLSSNPDMLEKWVKGRGELDEKHKRQLIQEYIVDFLLCNFDSFAGNFILDSNDNIRGVDKEQSFRFIDDIDSLKPDFSFTPNGNSRIPIYKILFERYQTGEIDLDFTIFDEKIKIIEEMTDKEYRDIFRPYAESLHPENPDILLDKIVQRKHICTQNMKSFINRIRNDKSYGEGVLVQ